jgi:ubiquitin-protein ligase
LREDYNPTVTIKMIIFGLISLFEVLFFLKDPTPLNPLNIEVAQILKDNKE